MMTINSGTQPVAQWMRWIARIISSLATAFWLLILIDILLCDLVVGCVSVTWDMALLLFLVVASIASVVIAWRRDIHANPELSNREFRTAALVAKHLRALGFDSVETEIAHTGVVGTLVGGKPGPVVALRADMDGLPVKEQTGRGTLLPPVR